MWANQIQFRLAADATLSNSQITALTLKYDRTTRCARTLSHGRWHSMLALPIQLIWLRYLDPKKIPICTN